MKKKWIALVAAGSLVLGTPVVVNAQDSLGGPAQVRSASSEDVLSAAFFGTGPLAGDELRATLPEEISQEKWDGQVSAAMDELVAHDAEEVDRIAEDLTSGSPVLVEQAVADGEALMTEAFALDESEDDGYVSPRCGLFGAVCVAAAFAFGLSTAVAQNSVAVTTVAAVTQAAWRWNGVGSAESQLEREQAIAIYTESLAA
ncbi:hypothetical protein [Nocardiopsis ganjiahuensis]|uniref:hypothetical protein n=1 Tax=Nocardiopsis ganjiahuensis TaxID=239984 RepID=UPI000347E637|nr:hypothetical protein [Nocardiopsis ganjiahuensis]